MIASHLISLKLFLMRIDSSWIRRNRKLMVVKSETEKQVYRLNISSSLSSN